MDWGLILPILASQELLDSVTASLNVATCTPESVARLTQANTDFRGMLPLVVKAYLVHHQRDSACVRLKTLVEGQ